MPEMSVVRFNESDVIVASIFTVRLAHFNDGQPHNGTITVDSSTVYGYPASGQSGIQNIIDSVYYTGDYRVATRAGSVFFKELISLEGENPYSTDGSDDGLYVYNQSSNTFERRQ